jgi:hypothetical protein
MLIEMPDSFIDQIAERVKQKLEAPLPDSSEQVAPETLEMKRKLDLIRAKERISVAEAALLLNCSDGHVRNLVKKAKKKQGKRPIPFCDLDGVMVFNRVALLEWAEERDGDK